MAHPRNTLALAWEKIRARSVRVGDCLVWQGAKTSRGYGSIHVEGRFTSTHRAAYEIFNGPIPEGLTIDHVAARGCRFTACCEPTHLEAVTQRENNRRGGNVFARNAAKTHCNHGHALEGANVYRGPDGFRNCRTCKRIALAKRKKKVAS